MSPKPCDGNVRPTHDQRHQWHHQCHDGVYFNRGVGVIFVGFIKAIRFIIRLVKCPNNADPRQAFTKD